MKLHNLQTPKGATHRTKRLGAGVGTGLGKTSGKGHKGARSRSGYSIHPGFEGGQMPMYRRMPHRGFNNKNFRTEYDIINVGDIEKLELEEITLESLIKVGVIGRRAKLLKILGHGELTRKVSVTADKVSGSAKEKIEKAGGSVTLPQAAAQEEQA